MIYKIKILLKQEFQLYLQILYLKVYRKIYSKFKTLNPNICYSALLPEGVFFNNNFITNTEHLNKQKYFGKY